MAAVHETVPTVLVRRDEVTARDNLMVRMLENSAYLEYRGIHVNGEKHSMTCDDGGMN